MKNSRWTRKNFCSYHKIPSLSAYMHLECGKIFSPRSSFKLISRLDWVHFRLRSILSSCFSFQMLRMPVCAKHSLGKGSTKTPSQPWPNGLNNCSSRWRWRNSHPTVLCSITFKVVEDLQEPKVLYICYGALWPFVSHKKMKKVQNATRRRKTNLLRGSTDFRQALGCGNR